MFVGTSGDDVTPDETVPESNFEARRTNGHVAAAVPRSDDGPRRASARFDVIAIASSAGGLAALTRLLSSIEASFPASILVVQHLDPRHESLMADILSRRTELTVKQ